jgi:hypothetical protein
MDILGDGGTSGDCIPESERTSSCIKGDTGRPPFLASTCIFLSIVPLMTGGTGREKLATLCEAGKREGIRLLGGEGSCW